MGIIESDHDSLSSVSIISDYSSTTGDSFTTNTSEDATLLNRFNKVVLENATNKERIVEILSALPDLVIPKTYTEVDTLEYDFSIPSGTGIHEVIITVDTNDSTWTLADLSNLDYYLTHTGDSIVNPLQRGINNPANYSMDLSETTGDDDGVNILITATAGNPVIILTLTSNPSDGPFLGMFDGTNNYSSTEDWTFLIEGFDSHTIETGISAKDILGIPACLPITEVYTEVDTLEHDFSIPSGIGIHSIVIGADTNDTNLDPSDLTYKLTHDGSTNTRTFYNNVNTNFTWDLSSELGTPVASSIHVETTFSSGVVTLILWINPHVTEGSYGQIPSTQEWTFSIEGLDSHTINTSISATDTSGDPVALT